MLVREGVLGGVSLEAKPVKSSRSRDGVVQRVKAHLRHRALPRRAYAGAVVLAVRDGRDPGRPTFRRGASSRRDQTPS
jgi:hypothetical protein